MCDSILKLISQQTHQLLKCKYWPRMTASLPYHVVHHVDNACCLSLENLTSWCLKIAFSRIHTNRTEIAFSWNLRRKKKCRRFFVTAKQQIKLCFLKKIKINKKFYSWYNSFPPNSLLLSPSTPPLPDKRNTRYHIRLETTPLTPLLSYHPHLFNANIHRYSDPHFKLMK